ncbi:hypothetical protein M0802_016614 [Mischocyttarus mexicanus]|nr:hypothetical protein M0802_016614 [Mischocyttarus mexicanus]
MEPANAVGAANSLARAFEIEVVERMRQGRKRVRDLVSYSPFARDETVQKVLCEW